LGFALEMVQADTIVRHRKLIGDIIKRFEDRGLKVAALHMVTAEEETLNKHYPLSDRDYITSLGHVDTTNMNDEEKEELYQKNYKIVENLQTYMASGPVVKIVFEAENAVALVREIVGKTDPAKSPEGSIRGDLGIDSFAKADEEHRSVENLVHASGTVDEANQEIALWFPEVLGY
jgi:nucleoside-diphosphate kinase